MLLLLLLLYLESSNREGMHIVEKWIDGKAFDDVNARLVCDYFRPFFPLGISVRFSRSSL